MAAAELQQLNQTYQVPANYPVKLTRLQLEIARLLGNPLLKKQDIAKTLKCDRATVTKVARLLKQHAADVVEPVESYRRLLREQVPDSLRVGQLERIVKSKSEFAALQGIQYVDSVLGLAPVKRTEAQDTPNEQRPMFNLPGATSVTVNLIQQQPAIQRIEALDIVVKADNDPQ